MVLEKHILLSNLYSFLLDRTERIRYLFIRKARCVCLPLGDRLPRYGGGGTKYQKGRGGCALAQTEGENLSAASPHTLRGDLSQRGALRSICLKFYHKEPLWANINYAMAVSRCACWR